MARKSKKATQKDLAIKKAREDALKIKRAKRVRYEKKTEERIEQEMLIEKILVARKAINYIFQTEGKELLKYSIKELKNHLDRLNQKRGIRHGKDNKRRKN